MLYSREENTEHVTAGKVRGILFFSLINLTSVQAVSSMSARRDNNAPVQLPLEHVGLILNEPELVDMRRAREKVPVLYFLLFSMLTSLSARQGNFGNLRAPGISRRGRGRAENSSGQGARSQNGHHSA